MKKLAIFSALVAAVTFTVCTDSETESQSSGSFVKVTRHSVGTPTSVSSSPLVLAYACCDGDFCVWVDKQSQCNFPNDVFYCTVGQSNPDGTITCYD